MSEPNGTSAQLGNPPADAGADAAPACDENTVNNASDTGQDALSARIETLEAELAQAREATLRVAADMENLRRRTQEDIAKAHKFASEAFAESLLSVRDALEAALAMPEMSLDSLREGVTVTLRQLESAFDKGKVTVINPVGEKFDPNVHQAVAMVPGNSVTPEVAPQHIVAVLQKGYRLHDRVLRPALVSVAQSA